MRDHSVSDKSPNDDDRITLLSVLKSVAAAAFGVQSPANRKRDFTKGNIWVFIIAGVLFTLIFVLTVITVVRVVLS